MQEITPDSFLFANGNINVSKVRSNTDYIVENFGKQLDTIGIEVSPSQRIKFEKYPVDSIYCGCGNVRRFSSHASECFKLTCGSPVCVAKYRKNGRSKFKATVEKRKTASVENFSREQLKSFIDNKVNEGFNLSALGTLAKCPEKAFVTKAAKDIGFRYNQYWYHILHGLDMVHYTCPHGTKMCFLSIEKGYAQTGRCCGTAKKSREVNKIAELIDEVPENLRIIETPPINASPWKFECVSCNHSFTQHVKNGRGCTSVKCPKCTPKNVSSYEFDILDTFGDLYDGKIIHTYRIPGSDTKKKGTFKTLDVFFPEKNLAVEVNGMNWHADDKWKHRDRKLMCEESGIDLLQFTDYDMDTRRDIVMSMIANKLGINQRRIAARKCVIRDIPTNVYRKFCEDNHIKGYAAASVKYGMFHGDELVSVFSISKSRFRSGEMELIRFCTVLNTTVMGALGKFIKHHGEGFITFADLHYGSGKSYEKMGMEFLGNTEPNYVYFRGSTQYSRMKFQKHKLKELFPDIYDDSLSEKQIMERTKYKRYYDCGNAKYRYEP